MSSYQPKINKSTIPAYPELLVESLPNETEKLRPAAFPSLSLKRQRGSTEQGIQRNGSGNAEHSEESQPLVHFRSQPDLADRKETSFQSWTTIENLEDPEMVHDEVPRQENLVENTQIYPARPSPGSSDMPTDQSVPWNKIDPCLQLYIFDSLLQQFQQPEFVGEVLGIDTGDLRRLVALKHERDLRPETVDELWDYCRWLGNGEKMFVEPEVLQAYIDYFAYVSQFENASITQRHTAIAFLRQRSIEGAFVDALLPKRPGIWTRPEYKKQRQLYTTTQFESSAYDDGAEWVLMLSKISVHKSHKLEIVADHFKSSYFPQRIRNNFLTNSADDLDAFNKWLMYGTLLPTTMTAKAISEYIARISPKSTAAMDPILHSLSTMFEHWGKKGADIETFVDHSGKIHLMLYTITRAMCQSRLLRQKLKQMPLNPQQRNAILKAARKHADMVLHEKLKFLMSEAIQNSTSESWTPTDGHSDQSTTSIETHKSLRIPASNDSQIDAVVSSRLHAGKISSSAATVEEDGRGFRTSQHANHKSKVARLKDPEFSSTKQVSKHIESITSLTSGEGQSQRLEIDHGDRDPSEDSFYTALDHESDADINTKLQQLVGRSPSPPPWSPLTEAGEDTQNVDSLPDQVRVRAAIQPDALHIQDFALRRATPWKSSNAIFQHLLNETDVFRDPVLIDKKEKAPDNSTSKSSKIGCDKSKVSVATVPRQETPSPSAKTAPGRHTIKDAIQPKTQEQGQSDLQMSDSIFQTQPELLAGIREAPISVSSLPSASSSDVPLTTEASHRQPRMLLPLPPIPSEQQHSNAPRPRPQKSKPEDSLPVEAPNKPQLQTTRPALTSRGARTSATPSPVPSTSIPHKKPRSDKGKKRRPYGKRKTDLSPEAGIEANTGAGRKRTDK